MVVSPRIDQLDCNDMGPYLPHSLGSLNSLMLGASVSPLSDCIHYSCNTGQAFTLRAIQSHQSSALTSKRQYGNNVTQRMHICAVTYSWVYCSKVPFFVTVTLLLSQSQCCCRFFLTYPLGPTRGSKTS